MKRFTRVVTDTVLILFAVILVVGLFMLVIGFVIPDSVTSLRIGTDLFRSQVTEETGTIVHAVKINPLVDLLLIAGAYVLVSLINWSQDRIVLWWTNRGHFE